MGWITDKRTYVGAAGILLVVVGVVALLVWRDDEGPGANAELGSRLGHPILGAVINFLIGLTFLTVISVAIRAPRPDFARAASGPWWAWTGGFMGAAIVTTSLLLTRQMGVAAMLAAVVTGQLIASLAVDHYGLVGQPVMRLTPARFVGVVMVIVGTFVIQYERATTPVQRGGAAPNSPVRGDGGEAVRVQAPSDPPDGAADP